MLETQKQAIKDLIAKGRSADAIKDLTSLIKSPSDQGYLNDLTQLSARWKSNEHAYNLGTLGTNDYNTEKNKINKFLLELLDEINGNAQIGHKISADNAFQPMIPCSSPHLSGKIKVFWKKWAIMLTSMLATLAALAEFSGWNIREIFTTPSTTSLQLTVYVQTVDGKPVPELQNKGKIFVDFGNDRRGPLIGENGRTNLGEIPNKFKNQEIPIVFQSDGYEPVEKNKKYTMDGRPVYIYIEPDNRRGLIQGIVKNRTGEQFISNALVMIDNDTTTVTDSLGRFHLQLPKNKQRERYLVTVKKEGFKPFTDFLIPQTGNMEIRISNN